MSYSSYSRTEPPCDVSLHALGKVNIRLVSADGDSREDVELPHEKGEEQEKEDVDDGAGRLVEVAAPARNPCALVGATRRQRCVRTQFPSVCVGVCVCARAPGDYAKGHGLRTRMAMGTTGTPSPKQCFSKRMSAMSL